MNREQYLHYQEFFRTHKAWLVLAGFFSTHVVWLYLFSLGYFLWASETREVGLILVVGAGLAKLVLAKMVSSFLPRPRPYQVFGFSPVAGLGLFTKFVDTKDSFPSGHAAAMTTITFLLFPFSSSLAVVSMVLVLLNGIFRMLLGFHFARDVFAGVVLGFLVAFGMIGFGLTTWLQGLLA